MITQTQYEVERAICDKAQAYWKANATFTKDGWSSMGKELCARPDYAVCDNAMRGRVEQFELHRDRPDRFTAYISSDGNFATVWTGDKIGQVIFESKTERKSQDGAVYAYVIKSNWGKTYRGYGMRGLCINLKLAK
jgi:hypothetical protein